LRMSFALARARHLDFDRPYLIGLGSFSVPRISAMVILLASSMILRKALSLYARPTAGTNSGVSSVVW